MSCYLLEGGVCNVELSILSIYLSFYFLVKGIKQSVTEAPAGFLIGVMVWLFRCIKDIHKLVITMHDFYLLTSPFSMSNLSTDFFLGLGLTSQLDLKRTRNRLYLSVYFFFYFILTNFLGG